MAVLILNGPNLNCLQFRSPEHYGTLSYAELVSRIESWAKENRLEVEIFQSNSEGELISAVQKWELYQGLIFNFGAYSHYSYALRDALEMVKKPKVEVHLSNVFAREDFRRKMITAAQANALLIGFGPEVYRFALMLIKKLLSTSSQKDQR